MYLKNFNTKKISNFFITTNFGTVFKNKKESIALLENCYVCDDPFSAVKSYNYLVLGANCFTCNQMCCMSNECSIFYYKKRFCLKCAEVNLKMEKEEFPVELKNELVKLINSKNDE